jgi:hypothetical protein
MYTPSKIFGSGFADELLTRMQEDRSKHPFLSTAGTQRLKFGFVCYGVSRSKSSSYFRTTRSPAQEIERHVALGLVTGLRRVPSSWTSKIPECRHYTQGHDDLFSKELETMDSSLKANQPLPGYEEFEVCG